MPHLHLFMPHTVVQAAKQAPEMCHKRCTRRSQAPTTARHTSTRHEVCGKAVGAQQPNPLVGTAGEHERLHQQCDGKGVRFVLFAVRWRTHLLISDVASRGCAEVPSSSRFASVYAYAASRRLQGVAAHHLFSRTTHPIACAHNHHAFPTPSEGCTALLAPSCHTLGRRRRQKQQCSAQHVPCSGGMERRAAGCNRQHWLLGS
jgi:hypothetical protein